MYKNIFDLGLENLNITCNTDKFYLYMDLLLEYNEKFNLTTITDKEEIILKHFLDSILILNEINISKDLKIVDVGTGAGFPSIPIKIVRDDLDFTLIDSLNKRVSFLNEVIKNLNLRKINTYHGRSECFGQDELFREKFDIGISRAVASLNILSEYCLPLIKNGGFFYALKSENILDEIENSKKSISILGGKIVDIIYTKIPISNEPRSIVIIEKISNTPINYPRKSNQIKKKPL